jgi:3-phenylpropionate/trans-cinnamate dioxygenase ferredoxin reductase component
MNNYKYIIVGGGMTGDAAVKGIREIDKDGSVLMVSSESNPPYSRPPLTKGLWKDTPEEKIWKKTGEQNVEIILNSGVAVINTDKSITLYRGDKLTYDKLLLATGGTPRTLPFDGENIIYYRTYDDYKKLRTIADKNDNFAVIGGGFIGSEIAAALTRNGKKVTMIFPGKYIGERIFPKHLAEFVTNYYISKGVNLLAGDTVNSIESKNDLYTLGTKNGNTLTANCVIGGIGIKPNTALADSAGIKTDNGINVDEFLMTSRPDVYAAGDAANFYNPLLGKRIRVEHEDNANKMGKHAGKVMAGKEEPYDYLPFFYSDLFELGYEAIGELDPNLEIYEDWKEKYKEGVVYYMKNSRVRGVLLWNVWSQVDEARKLIAEKGPFKPEDLKVRLPVKK